MVIPVAMTVTVAWLVSLGALIYRGHAYDLQTFLALTALMWPVVGYALGIKINKAPS